MKIGFHKLLVCCVIGVLEQERQNEQELFITLEAACRPPEGDVLEEAVDYSRLAALCEQTAKEGEYQLIETLAAAIAARLFDEERITSLKLRIEKPAALPAAAAAFVEVEKRR